jgi:serine/threonine-protein kinase
VWPWLLVLLALAIGAAGGYLLYQKIQKQLNENKPVGVVDVARLRAPLAKLKLQQEGFVVVTKFEANGDVPVGSVADQSPPGGDRAAKGSTVTIYVSTGAPRTTVPAVKGFTLTQALSMLSDAQLKADPHFIFSDANANTITAQAPKSGKIVLVGTKVRINVSKGLKPLSVPNVVGQTYNGAYGALVRGGFKVTRLDVDSESPKGQIVSQEPLAGAQVAVGTSITVSVSKGPQVTQVPDVTGQAQADAEALLSDAGFQSMVETRDVTDPASDGLVLSQQPQGGKVVKKGTPVTLVVGQLTTPPPAETTPAPTDTTTITTTPASSETSASQDTSGSSAASPPADVTPVGPPTKPAP